MENPRHHHVPPVPRKKPLPPSNRWRRILTGATIGLGAVGAIVFFICLYYAEKAASLELADLGKIPERNVVLDSRGAVYSRVEGENRVLIPLDEVSKDFLKALLAREDTRFFEHEGIDMRGIARATVRNCKAASYKEGGSTLTQQLARNSFPLGGQTLRRKAYEAMVSMRIEREFSKWQILEFYVNRIYFGHGLWGIETASQAYFNKPSSKLNLSESAMLAGIIRGPNRYSPIRNFEGAIAQRDGVLDRMVKLNMITPEQGQAAKSQKIALTLKRQMPVQQNYAMDTVRREIEELLTPDQIDRGGLKIHTTIDPKLQSAAEQALNGHLRRVEIGKGFKRARQTDVREPQKGPEPLQGALIAIDHRSGAIRAVVGGRDYQQSQFNRALQGRRQLGSTFKPFVYAGAIQKGLLPGTLVSDQPLRPGEIQAAPRAWHPVNAKGDYHGNQPAKYGLIQSRNTMTARVGDLAGLDDIKRIAGQVGLGENFPRVPAIYLGAFEATLKELTAAYSAFPNGGIRTEPYVIERIEDGSGATVYQAKAKSTPVLEVDVAWMVSRMLEEVIDHGTGTRARAMGFNKPAAGKTGTTDDFKDAWFVGYTTSLTCGVWVGFDQPRVIMHDGFGAELALPIWTDFMKKVPDDRYPAREFSAPLPVRTVNLCSLSDGLASASCGFAGCAYSIEMPETKIPNWTCPGHGGVYTQRTDDYDYDYDAAPPPAPVVVPVSTISGDQIPVPQTAPPKTQAVQAIPVDPEEEAILEGEYYNGDPAARSEGDVLSEQYEYAE